MSMSNFTFPDFDGKISFKEWVDGYNRAWALHCQGIQARWKKDEEDNCVLAEAVKDIVQMNPELGFSVFGTLFEFDLQRS